MLIGEKICTIRSSANLSLFWPLLLVSLAPNIKVQIESLRENFEVTNLILIITLVSACLMMSLLQFWPDTGNLEPKYNDLAPNNTNSFFSSVFLSWMNPLIWKGYKVPLTQNDLFELPRKINVNENVEKFQNSWNAYLASNQISFSRTDNRKRYNSYIT